MFIKCPQIYKTNSTFLQLEEQIQLQQQLIQMKFAIQQQQKCNIQDKLFSGYLIKSNLIIVSLLIRYDVQQLKRFKAIVFLPQCQMLKFSMDDNDKVIIGQGNINGDQTTILYIRIDNQSQQVGCQCLRLDYLFEKFNNQINSFHIKLLHLSLALNQKISDTLEYDKGQESIQISLQLMQTHVNYIVQCFQENLLDTINIKYNLIIQDQTQKILIYFHLKDKFAVYNLSQRQNLLNLIQRMIFQFIRNRNILFEISSLKYEDNQNCLEYNKNVIQNQNYYSINEDDDQIYEKFQIDRLPQLKLQQQIYQLQPQGQIKKMKTYYLILQKLGQSHKQKSLEDTIIDPVCIQIMDELIQTIRQILFQVCKKHNRLQNYYVCKNDFFKKNYYLCNQCIKQQDHKDHRIICRCHRMKLEYIEYNNSSQEQIDNHKQLYLCILCPNNQTAYKLTQCHHEAIKKISFQFNQATFFQPARQFVYSCPKCFEKEFKQNEILEMDEQNKEKIKLGFNKQFKQQIDVSYFEKVLIQLQQKLQLGSIYKIINVYLQKTWFIWSYIDIYHLNDTSKRDKIVQEIFNNPNKQNLFKLWLIQNKQFFRYDERSKYIFLEFLNDKITVLIEQFLSSTTSKIENMIQKIYKLILNEDMVKIQQFINKKYQTVTNRKDKSKYRQQNNIQSILIAPLQICQVSPANFYQIERHNQQQIRHLIIEKDIQQHEQVNIKQLISLGVNLQYHCDWNDKLFKKQDVLSFKKLCFNKKFSLEIRTYTTNQQKINIENTIKKQNGQYLQKNMKEQHEKYLLTKDEQWFQMHKIKAVILFSQSTILKGQQVKEPAQLKDAALREDYQRYLLYVKTLERITQQNIIKKQWSQRIKQPKLFKLIIDSSINNLLSIVVKYNYYKNYNFINPIHNYSMTIFDLFEVINLNKSLQLCSIQGIQITEFTKFIHYFKIFQEGNAIQQISSKQQNKINIIKKIMLNNQFQLKISDATIQISTDNIQKLQQITNDFLYFQNKNPTIIIADIKINLNNLNQARNNLPILLQLLGVMKKLKDFHVRIYNGYHKQIKQINNQEPIVFLFEQLQLFTNIKGLAFEALSFFDQLSETQTGILKKSISKIIANNQIQYLSLINCMNFEWLLPYFTKQSLKLFEYYNWLDLGRRLSALQIMKFIEKNEQIEVLHLLNSDRTNSHKITLQKLNYVNQLILGRQYVDDQCILSISQKAAFNFEYIYLSGNYPYTNISTSLKIIFPRLHNISKLTLRWIAFNAQHLLLTPSIYLNNLQFIDCESITDEILLEIDRKWPTIKYLFLSWCINLSAKYIKRSTFKALIKLRTFYNVELTSDQRYMLQLRGVIVEQNFPKKLFMIMKA